MSKNVSEHNKLLELLQSMRPTEINYLEKVVQSPCMNQNAHVKGLFEILKPLHPHFGSVNKLHKSAHSVLFPGQAYDNLKMRHLMSMLLKLAEQSLILPDLKASYEARLLLIEAYQKRDLNKHLRGTLRQAERKAEAMDGRSPEAFYQSFRMGMVAEDVQLPGKPRPELLQWTHESLDRFYISAKLRQACALLSRRNLYKGDFAPAMLTEWVTLLDQMKIDAPLVVLYRLALDTLLHPELEAAYPLFKSALQAHDQLVDQEIAMELHILARNYCIKRMNEGDVAYIKELFELYELALQRGYLMGKDGKIKPSAFKNVVTTGLKLSAYDRIERFIEDFGQFLPEENQAAYLPFCKGMLLFGRGNFRAAARMVRLVEGGNFFVEMDARILLIKTWFELEELDLMEAAVQNATRFLQRNRLMAYHRKSYSNALRLMKRMLSVRVQSKTWISAFQTRVLAVEPLSERNWIVAKLRERGGG